MKSSAGIVSGFLHGLLGNPGSHKRCKHAEKELRAHLSDAQVDKMIEGSFPASDPSSTY